MTARHEREQAGGAPRTEAGHASREAAFRRARRHSRRVRFLKFALPLGAVLAAGSFAGYSWLSVPGTLSFSVAESGYTDGKLVMANPKLGGYTKENRPYSMTAKRALQHVDKTGIVELEGIDAKLPVSKDVFAMVGAEHGVYNRDSNTLAISSPLSVKTTDGTVVELKSAYVDIDKGDLKTDDPVDIKMAGAQIMADAMSVLENGKVLVFEKRVRMQLKPDRIKPRESSPEESTDQHVSD
jgi:lipopolysaccharide export system protein LptC